MSALRSQLLSAEGEGDGEDDYPEEVEEEADGTAADAYFCVGATGHRWVGFGGGEGESAVSNRDEAHGKAEAGEDGEQAQVVGNQCVLILSGNEAIQKRWRRCHGARRL